MSFQHPFQETQFDIFDWYPNYQSCLRFFHDHAQYTNAVQAVAANVNIRLPFQKTPIPSASDSSSRSATPSQSSNSTDASLIPYVRRLVATGFDSPAILHGFFGDDWSAGVGAIQENERRNFLFAAKSETWLKVKASYDLEDGQVIPFLRPLHGVTEKEIELAEASWSEWLAMQDWMLGPRAPLSDGSSQASRGNR